MTGTPENRECAVEGQSGEATLYRLAEVASSLGMEQIAATARSIAERVSEGRFYVACVGQFKRGKSTLLNALIGKAVLPTGVVPVTTVPTVIRYGKSVTVRVRFDRAEWSEIPFHAIEEYVSEGKNSENAKGVRGLEIFVPTPLLQTGMCLVDTPGLGSVFTGNTATTQAFIPHIDAALVVMGADPPLSGDELDLVETVAKQVPDLLFVLNKADRTSESERKAAIEFARKVLEKRLVREVPTALEVSALECLEGKGPSRDWPKLVDALERLMAHSGCTLVRRATERGIRRAADQVLGVIHEEREALLRPLEDSEQRIVRLKNTLQEAEEAMRDLGVLFAAEQQHLSQAFAERRSAFLKRAGPDAQRALSGCLNSIAHRHNGPGYRRELNHVAQDIARAELTPWLDEQSEYAEQAFRKIARRFVELGNSFLHRLGEKGVPGIEGLPEELGSDQGLRVGSQFHFHVLERVAAPASPPVFIFDLVRGAFGFRGGIIGDATEFLDELLEINSSRVQSDVEERVRESRRKLEAEIKGVLREASAVAERALQHAREAQAAGVPAIEAALTRLEALEHEVANLAAQARAS